MHWLCKSTGRGGERTWFHWPHLLGDETIIPINSDDVGILGAFFGLVFPQIRLQVPIFYGVSEGLGCLLGHQTLEDLETKWFSSSEALGHSSFIHFHPPYHHPPYPFFTIIFHPPYHQRKSHPSTHFMHHSSYHSSSPFPASIILSFILSFFNSIFSIHHIIKRNFPHFSLSSHRPWTYPQGLS